MKSWPLHLGVLWVVACNGPAATDDTDTQPEDTDEVAQDTDVAPSCDDGLVNGTESDVDCGGLDCDACVRGQDCVEPTDCDATVCVDFVCERALIVSGVASATGPLTGDYAASQSIVRINYATPPTVTGFDGAPIELAVSVGGEFVDTDLSAAPASARVVVAGIPMPGATGESYYQSIEPDYFGLIFGFGDGASATDAFDTLDAAPLAGQQVDIVIVDTTP